MTLHRQTHSQEQGDCPQAVAEQPWQIKVDALGYPSIYGTDEDGRPGDLVAHCFADHEHLIRSAPELLAALKGVLAKVIVWDGNPDEMIRSARAAIAKAEGRS